jgi:hypothetical protein
LASRPLRASSVLIFEGEIVWIQPTGTGLCESLKGREDGIKIDHALFGETEKGRIAASYGSVNCPIRFRSACTPKSLSMARCSYRQISRVFRQGMQRLRIWLP